MPEAYTYFDLQRRLTAAFPVPTRFRVDTFNINARLAGSTPATCALTGKAKKQSRISHPEDFRPDISKTFIGIERVPSHILDGFVMEGSDIRSFGKRLGIPLGDRWWIRIHL